MKLFTLDEAQALVPVLDSLLKRGIEGKQAAEKINEELQALSQRIFMSGGMHVDVGKIARQKTEMQAQIQRAKDAVEEIDAIGVQVKDLDIGLLDFPCKVDDDVVLLCWKMGESKITHWHTMEAGFQGRKPLDERFEGRSRKGGSEKPNWSAAVKHTLARQSETSLPNAEFRKYLIQDVVGSGLPGERVEIPQRRV